MVTSSKDIPMHIWDLFNCCPPLEDGSDGIERHTFNSWCLASSFTDSSGVGREIVASQDSETFKVITTWPLKGESEPWTISREGWRDTWEALLGPPALTFHEATVQTLHDWLGDEGRSFFKDCWDRQGRMDAVLPTDPERGILHPVHFREGMQVRNFLRELPECREWGAHKLDNRWALLVRMAVVE